MKRNRLARAVALGLGCTLAAGILIASVDIQNGEKIRNLVGSILAGVAPNDSTAHVIGATVEAGGSKIASLWTDDQHRDRDFSVITTVMGPIQELGPAQSVQMAQALPLQQYGHCVLLLSYTTQVPGDSDSVNVAINVYGTTSGNSANWDLFTPYSDTTGLAGDIAPDSSVAGAVTRGGVRPSYYITRNRYNALSVGKGTVTVAIPPPAYRYASPSGASIVLSDQNGEAPRFAYILLKVTNMNPRRSIKNVEIDAWPKVN